MIIFNYVDTLLHEWVNWNKHFLVEKLDYDCSSINDYFQMSGSNLGSRATELYRLGLLTKQISLKGKEGIVDLWNDKNVQTDLGFLCSLIYEGHEKEISNVVINRAIGAICALFCLTLSADIGTSKVTINYFTNRLLELFPKPEDYSDSNTWNRFILSAGFSEASAGDYKTMELLMDLKISSMPLRIFEAAKNNDRNSNRKIRYTISNSSEAFSGIINKVSLTGIEQQKAALFETSFENEDTPRGFYSYANYYFPDFLKICYKIEKDNPLLFRVLCRDFSSEKLDIINYLNSLNVGDEFYKQKESIMKSILDGAIEAAKKINPDINFGEQTIIHNYCSDSSSYINLLAAIRTKPFILLAGISGTGKSRIVRKLAQATVTEYVQQIYDPNSIKEGFNRWNIHKPANFELIQVKPNWHNSMDVVGYKSNIGGIHYEFTPFIEFIAKAWQHQDTPFFLCLDEMNLAPVEQYFAEFLSAIESRSIENGEYITDPIVKPFASFDTKDANGNIIDKLSDRMVAKLIGALDTQEKTNLSDWFKSKGLTLPKNLIVIGTVNMDETTFSFSRKVLDRAMSIEMNDVNYNDFFEGITEVDIPELNDEYKNSLINRPIKGLSVTNNCSTEVQVFLTAINNVLDETPFKLGYRAANEALLYVSASKLYGCDDITSALDGFTLMKILSRIEGDKRSLVTKEGEPLLTKLKEVINENYKESFKKLCLMEKILEVKQFVSYWT